MECVEVWVYDISNGAGAALLKALAGVDAKGIWHTAVVAYGREYYFRGGVQRAVPGRTHFGAPVEKLALGTTVRSREEFEAFLAKNAEKYTERTYDLFENNCNHFTDACAMFLVGQGVPPHIMELSLLVQNTPLGAMVKALMAPPKSPEA